MEYDSILNILAPCGLNCTKCMANADGDIKKHSKELQALLGDFDRYAQRFSNFLPVFNNYPLFKELLAFFASSDCSGCRKGECRYPNCYVMTCIRDKGVDFCFQCSEFPCDRTNFDADLKRRWIEMNSRMKEIGAQEYYEETKVLCRYR